MKDKFRKYVELAQKKYRDFKLMPLVKASDPPLGMPCKEQQGVYAFYEQGRPLYAGRSSSLRNRIQQHHRLSSGHNSASFAFNLACKAKGKKPGPGCSRRELERDPEFKRRFSEAKVRVGKMEVRFVEEKCSITQALLEIYVAVVLGTPYNDFKNH